jgi:Xaa-Pro aminopeptidase
MPAKNRNAYSARLRRLRRAVIDSELDQIVIVPGPNLEYLTGVTSFLFERPFLLIVPSEGEPQLVVPVLESGPYRDCPLDVLIHAWTDSDGPAGAMATAMTNLPTPAMKKRNRWGIEGRVPFQYLNLLMKYASGDFEDAEPILQGLREVKDKDEISLLNESAKILSKSFEMIPDVMQEGMTEVDLARKIEDLIYSNGATKVSDLLVQSGERAADPHSSPSAKKIRRGESIVLDLVSIFQGYHADITRTLCIGDSHEIREVYDDVLEAQSLAIAACRKDVPTGKIDSAARSSLRKAGLGEYFVHRTGHGLGLEVHEAPYIVEGGMEKLREGMVFTVEPGAYIPSRLGVRIEDDIRITGGKGIVTTTPPKTYGWWK